MTRDLRSHLRFAIHVEGSSFPNWNGTDQKRFVAIAGEQLTLTVRPTAGDIIDVSWKRANWLSLPSQLFAYSVV
jgi:hypothetical protein